MGWRAPDAPPFGAVPFNTAAPVISGTPGVIGSMLTTTNGTWGGVQPITFTYQWKRDGVNIGGATNSTYVQDKNDIGPAMTCVVTAHNNRGSTFATSNSLAYLPTTDALGYGDPAGLTPGLVGSWASAIFSPTASGAKRPTASQTSLNNTPGVTGNGTANVMVGALDLSAYSAIRFVCAAIDTDAATPAIVMENNVGGAGVDGGFAIGVNLSAGGDVSCATRGTTNLGFCSTAAGSIPLSTPTVISVCPDASLTKGVNFIRANGVSKALNIVNNTCGAGNFGSFATAELFGRDGGALFWPGTLGVWAIMSGNAQDAALDRVERFCAYRAGIAQW